MSRITILIYAIASYILFIGVSIWMGAFLLDIANIRSGKIAGSWPMAVTVDVVLIAAFGFAHSVMARPWFKRVWTQIIPPAAERATYVLQSSLFLMLIFWQWQPIPFTIWQAEGLGVVAILCLFAFGGVMIVLSILLLGHHEFVGLQQAWDHLNRSSERKAKFRTPLLYRVARHPLQLGIVIMLFAIPHMTAGGSFFALAMLAYIVVGLRFEERALLREFGDDYVTYQREVPMLIPFLGMR